VLDITGELCPMTFVRTRLALDAMQPGQILEVRLRGEEPRRSVPASAEALGHRVLSAAEQGEGVLSLRLLRA
jgi:TusA-related sulfurtransferase